MPQATFFPKQSPKDLKGALSALCRLFLDVYDEESEKQADLDVVYRFIGRVVRNVAAGEPPDA